MECIHCHKTVELDQRDGVYFALDDLDGTPDGHNNGKSCIDGDLHEVES